LNFPAAVSYSKLSLVILLSQKLITRRLLKLSVAKTMALTPSIVISLLLRWITERLLKLFALATSAFIP
jgi:hypothetical protein